ncbi:hypothetical protein [Granulicella sp. S190]|uniref:hypothetical protein n=1 Tax=Granulicella sp. S190 TaxID=1747226 RepID=UPI00131DC291|nr:hypothetical protein [Granulicella sp. S190]
MGLKLCPSTAASGLRSQSDQLSYPLRGLSGNKSNAEEGYSAGVWAPWPLKMADNKQATIKAKLSKPRLDVCRDSFVSLLPSS